MKKQVSVRFVFFAPSRLCVKSERAQNALTLRHFKLRDLVSNIVDGVQEARQAQHLLGWPVGRLYVARWEKEIRIVDITLLPEFRGTGIGTKLLRDLQTEARSACKSLTIHVERFNRALTLYQRLGFKEVEDKGVYLLMRWSDQ